MKSKTLTIAASIVAAVALVICIIAIVVAVLTHRDDANTSAKEKSTTAPSATATPSEKPQALVPKENEDRRDIRSIDMANSSLPVSLGEDCSGELALKSMPSQEKQCWITLHNGLGTTGEGGECFPADFLTFDPDLIHYGDLNGDGYEDAWGLVPIHSECVNSIGLRPVWIFNPEDPEHPHVANIEESGAIGREAVYEFKGDRLAVMSGDCEAASYHFSGTGFETTVERHPVDKVYYDCTGFGF